MLGKLKRSIFLVFAFGFALTACENNWDSEHPLMGAWVINKSVWNGQEVELPKPRSMKIYSRNMSFTLIMISKLTANQCRRKRRQILNPNLRSGLALINLMEAS